ncbi:MAG: outer membrane beta-barrel protein [Paludibacteraceae bacterium]|nr:outer membrane beta-barrel protein [Paludibacteraceae bacterium]
MKKAFITVALSLVVATSFSQQLSVTAGGTFSKWRDDFTSYRLGFDVGALCVFQSDSVPFCFNAALMLVDKGVCLDGKKSIEGGGEYRFRTSLYSVHVPATVGYKVSCYKGRMTVIPTVGIYADYGFFGKISQTAEISHLGGFEHYVAKYDGKDPYSEIEKLEYQGVKNFKRFDWGLHAGLQLHLTKQVYLYGGYDYGMNKVWENMYFNPYFSSFYLNLGYLFVPSKKKMPVLEEI